MKRRSLLKSLGALGLMPMVPTLPASAITSSTPAAAVTSAHHYKWAEMIVRAHNKISPGMLERLLKVDTATASALKSQLLEKGVISAQANSFGIHSAVKPLYEGAFVKPSSQIKNGLKKANETLDKMMDEEETVPENESNISDLQEEMDSNEELTLEDNQEEVLEETIQKA